MARDPFLPRHWWGGVLHLKPEGFSYRRLFVNWDRVAWAETSEFEVTSMGSYRVVRCKCRDGMCVISKGLWLEVVADGEAQSVRTENELAGLMNAFRARALQQRQ